MVRSSVVYVALQELLVLLVPLVLMVLVVLVEDCVETVATTSSRPILASPACDGRQAWHYILSSPSFRQALSDNTVRSQK